MQRSTLGVLLVILAIGYSRNMEGESHGVQRVNSKRPHSGTSGHNSADVNKGNENYSVRLDSVPKDTALRNGENSSFYVPEFNNQSEFNSASFVVRQESTASQSEDPPSANFINDEFDDSKEDDEDRVPSSRGLLAYFLQNFILDTIKTTTAATTTTTGAPTAETYSYATKNDWPFLYRLHCAGSRQSPINIERLTTMYEATLIDEPLEFVNYNDLPFNQLAINNGHSLQVTQRSALEPMIQKGGLAESYSLAQYHFHWGSVSTRGSEHTVDFVKYPIELHMVHYKTAYGSLAASLGNEDGVVVLAVLFELSSRDNPALNPIVEQISHAEEETVSGPYPPASLLPNNPKHFYTYEGSLTTPPCNEVVRFIVFKETQSISEAQLEQFRTLEDSHGEPLVDNFRDPQPLNGRTVSRSFDP